MKRAFDLILAVPACLILFPLVSGLALMVRIFLGRPAIFRQTRLGFHGKPFVMYKFRTMTNDRDERDNPLPDSERLTGIGKFLRASSLDELPELFNVLKDEMSLVGPRPLLMQYLNHYTPEQIRRHEL